MVENPAPRHGSLSVPCKDLSYALVALEFSSHSHKRLGKMSGLESLTVWCCYNRINDTGQFEVCSFISSGCFVVGCFCLFIWGIFILVFGLFFISLFGLTVWEAQEDALSPALT